MMIHTETWSLNIGLPDTHEYVTLNIDIIAFKLLNDFQFILIQFYDSLNK